MAAKEFVIIVVLSVMVHYVPQGIELALILAWKEREARRFREIEAKHKQRRNRK